MIISGVGQSAATRRMLEEAPCPVVQIMDLTDDPIQKIIGFSHFEAAQRMTEHLIQSGYRRIAFLGGMMNGRSLRADGRLSCALEEAGLFDPRLIGVPGPLPRDAAGGAGDGPRIRQRADGARSYDALLDRFPDLDAVFCNTDVLAIGALFACKGRGIAVPETFGIAGFNDFDYMEAARAVAEQRAHPPLALRQRRRCSPCGELLAGATSGEPVVDLGVEIMQAPKSHRPGRARMVLHELRRADQRRETSGCPAAHCPGARPCVDPAGYIFQSPSHSWTRWPSETVR